MHDAHQYKGRFAPTPSGPLHFGSLVTALASWLDARSHQGRWYLRIDDIDPPREQPGAADTICHQLEQFGLTWDQKFYQSQRSHLYRAAAKRLLANGSAFYCQLSRRQLAARHFGHPGKVAAVNSATNSAIRVVVSDELQTFHDDFQPDYQVNLQALGGAFVIVRRDGLFAYHLACAVDDAKLGITRVVRGVDLLSSSAQQQHLIKQLGGIPPAYAHTPTIMSNGQKLAKSTHSKPVDPARASALLYEALQCLQLTPPAMLTKAGVTDILAWGCAHWPPRRLPRHVDIG